jgi:hypothetical protein
LGWPWRRPKRPLLPLLEPEHMEKRSKIHEGKIT